MFESGPTIYTTRDGIRMTKAGVVKAKFSRRAQAWWKLKRITVSKAKTGKYYCSILYECPMKQREPVVPTAETTLGLKYSMGHFYVADNGEKADPPRWLKQSQEKLVRIQQKLARMEPGSRNYGETVQKYRLLHEHIVNQRKDFLHKQSNRIANGWDAVCMRLDALAEMSKSPLRKDVASSGYRMFREMLRYKLERQGKRLILLDRYTPTARTCSACGLVQDGVDYGSRTWTCPRCGMVQDRVDYAAHTWTCPRCGATHDREINAAKNIKLEGLARLSA